MQGIRIIEPSLFGGYEPSKKMFLHQVAINEDMGPLEVSSEAEAQAFKRQHGEAVEIIEKDGVFSVLIKRGGVLYIPKALKFDRFVAGQIPTSWDPTIFGLPEDIVKQVDPVTLYTLVSTAEALVSAGVTDPYEFYEVRTRTHVTAHTTAHALNEFLFFSPFLFAVRACVPGGQHDRRRLRRYEERARHAQGRAPRGARAGRRAPGAVHQHRRGLR